MALHLWYFKPWVPLPIRGFGMLYLVDRMVEHYTWYHWKAFSFPLRMASDSQGLRIFWQKKLDLIRDRVGSGI